MEGSFLFSMWEDSTIHADNLSDVMTVRSERWWKPRHDAHSSRINGQAALKDLKSATTIRLNWLNVLSYSYHHRRRNLDFHRTTINQVHRVASFSALCIVVSTEFHVCIPVMLQLWHIYVQCRDGRCFHANFCREWTASKKGDQHQTSERLTSTTIDYEANRIPSLSLIFTLLSILLSHVGTLHSSLSYIIPYVMKTREQQAEHRAARKNCARAETETLSTH